MSRLIILVLSLIFLVQAVNAQEKAPQLPDYKNWELEEWILDELLYKTNPSYTLIEAYRSYNGQRVWVFYEPISEKQHLVLESMDRLDAEKQIRLMSYEEPLFVVYFPDDEYGEYVYMYEKTRKWYEFYHLWQSEWRFVERFINPEASEIDAENIEKCIERKYKLQFPK